MARSAGWIVVAIPALVGGAAAGCHSTAPLDDPRRYVGSCGATAAGSCHRELGDGGCEARIFDTIDGICPHGFVAACYCACFEGTRVPACPAADAGGDDAR
jgi:hypothetical protein